MVHRWRNKLPKAIRAGGSLSIFKNVLKTHLFWEHLLACNTLTCLNPVSHYLCCTVAALPVDFNLGSLINRLEHAPSLKMKLLITAPQRSCFFSTAGILAIRKDSETILTVSDNYLKLNDELNHSYQQQSNKIICYFPKYTTFLVFLGASGSLGDNDFLIFTQVGQVCHDACFWPLFPKTVYWRCCKDRTLHTLAWDLGDMN